MVFSYEIDHLNERSVQKGVYEKKCSMKEVLKKEYMKKRFLIWGFSLPSCRLFPGLFRDVATVSAQCHLLKPSDH